MLGIQILLFLILISGGGMAAINEASRQFCSGCLSCLFFLAVIIGVVYWVAVPKVGDLDGRDVDHAIPIHNLDEYHQHRDGLYIKDPSGAIVLKGRPGLIRKDAPLTD